MPHVGTLASQLDEELDVLLRPSTTNSTLSFLADKHALGPTMMQCGARDEPRPFISRAFGPWPPAGPRAAVPLRSVSKTFVAVTILALVEQRAELGHQLTLATTAGELLGDDGAARCAFGARGDASPAASWRTASVAHLLSMGGPFDDSVNAAWRNISHRADHNGLPTVCDSPDGLASIELDGDSCVREIVLPVLERRPDCAGIGLRRTHRARARRLAHALSRIATDAPDLSCVDRHGGCCQWAKNGECSRNAAYMLLTCPSACGMCDPDASCVPACADSMADCRTWAAAGECDINPAFMRARCRRACGVCADDADTDAPSTDAGDHSPMSPEFRHSFARDGDQPRHSVRKVLTHRPGCTTSCVYDNWSYTLLDAVVMRATGKSVLHWVGRLLLSPLRMVSALVCSGLADGELAAANADVPCYDATTLRSPLGAWALRPPGPFSPVQVSNALMGSVEDVSRLAQLLLRDGELDGVRVLSKASVDLLFQSARNAAYGQWPMQPAPPMTSRARPQTVCMGMSSFGFGLGWCAHDGPTNSADGCMAADWFGWQGSYGTRFAILRDRGVYCAWTSNLPSGSDRRGHRLSGRHHSVAHRLAASMRRLWPPLP